MTSRVNDFLAAIVLGLVEGITEFLPISSTGHLLIAEHWLGARSDLFNIAIQAGAILAVTLIYRRRLWQLATGLSDPATRLYAAKLGVAFALTAGLGLLVAKLGFTLPETVGPVAWALVIGGVFMLAVETAAESGMPQREVSWTAAIFVGLAQIIAGIFPGTSRSAATIFAAMLAGTRDRAAATEFAFLVGIPTMYAASGYTLFKHVRAHGIAGEDWSALAVAFVVSTVTAFAAVRWLLGYLRAHRFTPFAIYRIALGVALLLGLSAGA